MTCSTLTRTLRTLSVLLLGLIVAAPADAQFGNTRPIQIEDVRVGFPAGALDLYKVGKWVPVLVTVGPPKELGGVLPAEFRGRIEIESRDGDGWVTHLTKNNVTVAVVRDDGVIEQQLVGKSRVRGLDLEAKAELNDSIDVLASYSYLESEVVRSGPIYGVDVEGNEFASTPNHLASIWVNYTVPGTETRGDMTFGLGARYTGSYYFNLANDSGKSEATTLLDFAFTYQVQEATDLALNVSNLLDEQHVVGSGTANYYNPGRTISATLRHRF